MLGALLFGSLAALNGCGAGTYQIPDVAPVVKPKPEDDLLEDIENGSDESKPASTSDAQSAPPADKHDAAPSEAKPADSGSSTATPPAAPADTKAAAKPPKSGKK
jgi:hypothetical protein